MYGYEFTEKDIYLFHEGTEHNVYRKMGAHTCDGGAFFNLYAPHAKSVAVISARTGWDVPWYMNASSSGIWSLFIPGIGRGDSYRYMIEGADGTTRYKSDPFAFYSEIRPDNASIVESLDTYTWHDDEYMSSISNERKELLGKPMSIYELHPGSWKKDYRKNKDGFLNYAETAAELVEYVKFMGFTHVELIGICEHPLDASWGYQVTGYYAPTSRYGTPDDFRYLVDLCHQNGIGVIIDWVPAHFPKDPHGLGLFDGTHLYEPDDPFRMEYPEWGTYAFDHGKPEVRSFLISNAFYWIREFHADALRVDAVASMLFLGFGREKWIPNRFGGDENIESVDFLKELNYAVTRETKGYLIAEDSSIRKGMTDDVSDGGIGFMFKWNMGWMNDSLKYFKRDTIYRKYHHEEITHTFDYAMNENYVLVLSHDEVVHLKKSMLEKLPGNDEDKKGGLKTLYAYQFTHPGKKLLFMGQEFGSEREWDENGIVDWGLTHKPGNRDVMLCVRRLCEIYKEFPVLYEDFKDPASFEWINRNDRDRNILSYIRKTPGLYNGALVVILNLSPVRYPDYRAGVPLKGRYRRIFSSYDFLPGGGGPEELGRYPEMISDPTECDGRENSIGYGLRPNESVILEVLCE